MPSKQVSNFLPSTNGLRFINSWPSQPDFIVPTPFGDVGIGDASNGLCGGMVFTVRDLFEAELPPPADTTPPSQGTPLFDYIAKRLIDSFNLPGGVLKYYEWMNTPDHDTSIWFLVRRGLAWRTIVDEWPRIRGDIDSGHPSPLGLVTVYSPNPGDLGHNHQVLAYGYDLDPSNRLTLRLYDPNTALPTADAVTLSLNLSNPTHTTPIAHSVNISYPIRGFFRVDYDFVDPSRLTQKGPAPSVSTPKPSPVPPSPQVPMPVPIPVPSAIPTPLKPGTAVEADFTQYGSYLAYLAYLGLVAKR